MESTKNNNLNDPKQIITYVCAGLFALAALFNLIYAIKMISYISTNSVDIFQGVGVTTVLIVICAFILLAGCAITAFFVFTRQDAKIGFIILAAANAFAFIIQIILLVQTLQITYGYMTDGLLHIYVCAMIAYFILMLVFVAYLVFQVSG